MKYTTIKGEKLSRIGLGTAELGLSFNEAQEIAALRTGIDHGINIIDTAEMYSGSEEVVGKAIKGLDRDQIFLTTKFLPTNSTPQRLRSALQQSLTKLQLDYVDLYLLHWRANADLARTVAELVSLQKEGLIRHWGVSNFDQADMEDLIKVPGGDQCFANQDLYNVTARGVEYDLLLWQKQHDVGFLSYSPFHAVGWHQITPKSSLTTIAHKHHVSPQAVILAWIMRTGQVIPLPKAGNACHVLDNISALDLQLDDQDLALIDRDYPAPTHKIPLQKI